MQGLIQKSGYIKPGGGAGHYAEYIGTRDGVELLNAGDQYLKYIAERPRSHGLFSNVPNTDLEKTMQEVNSHSAPVWTFIYSLKREDAARLGYNSAESWRKLLLAHQTELAEAMKIPPNQFRWCAAFHDEKHHPHIHMMVWSADPKQGYLTEQGIEAMRSKLTNDIFQDELLHLYKQKDLSYQEVRDTAQEAMRDLVQEMKSGVC
ncbi:MAG: relaxase MobL, partial [Lachnospiraceae bacterium]|nr:relaxase MobL [Lachnospiraceae bacterium]